MSSCFLVSQDLNLSYIPIDLRHHLTCYQKTNCLFDPMLPLIGLQWQQSMTYPQAFNFKTSAV